MGQTFKAGLVGGIAGALIVAAGSAIAGTAINGIFNLGADNAVSKTSILESQSTSFTGPQLQVKNKVGGTALDLQVNAGQPPMTVNSKTKVANLNADQLDGMDSGAFARGRPPAWTAISGTSYVGSPTPGTFLCYFGYTGNCYQNYGSGYTTAAFTKDAFGFVHLKGLVDCNDEFGGVPKCSAAGPIFVLPAGYRPSERSIFPSVTYNGSYLPGRVDVDVNGQVIMVNGYSEDFVSLDGITFPVASSPAAAAARARPRPR